MSKTRQLPLINLLLLLTLSACSAPATSAPQAATIAAPVTQQQPTLTPVALPSTPPNTPTPKPDARPKPGSGPLTIVAIGDSLTQGDGDDTGRGGFPPRLQTRVAELRPGSQVINLGKSGWTSADVLNGINDEPAQLTQALAAKPDIVLIWVGSNDLWYLYEYGPEPITAESEQQNLENFAINLDAMLSQLDTAGAAVLIALLDDQSKRPVIANPPNPAEPAFSAITPEDIVRMSAHVSDMNAIIAQKASEYGAQTVDFYHTDIFTNSATLYSDGNHPNIDGYEIITKIWFTAIQALIK